MSAQPLNDRIGAVPSPELPRHDDIATWRTATADDIDHIHRVHAGADAADHPTWITPREEVADTFELSHIDHGRDTVIGFGVDGTPLVFSSAFLHPSREGTLTVHIGGAVDPQWRRRGIGSAALAWSHARALEQLAEAAADLPATHDGEAWKLEIKVYAEESTPDVIAITEPLGFHVERWFTTMVRDMSEPVPAPPAVPDATIVAYSSDRALDVLAARNDAFRDHWGSLPTSEESWQKFVGGEFLRPDLSRIALDADGAVIALCLASVNRDDWEALGATHAYIDLIGVVRAHRRRGLAPAVIAATLAAIAEEGLEKAVLDVDTASPTGANTLYERLGFAATERSLALVHRL
ncbi:MAG: GNAT family N-acetyltransferase [Candidatus Microbacterium phytovorans]|uniref:GNAT family N-acetyltransferase n=1 Tax=Candidatus Microbacterium phytovorans TaxID=3121374 RepID=A0AAJ6B597_9MICO|nr:GNAT family N-acetyltransferase [Microbacterium sp.]WEK13596.1 MAG: GNAT family N-acetyltransferase [Microbacterium sp.]